jgi:hypothetical protein
VAENDNDDERTNMTWRIPPVGWCAVCLVARDQTTPAATTFRGTALCQDHLAMVFENDIEMTIMEARREDEEETPTGPVVRGSTATCLHCEERIIYSVHTADEWSHLRHGDRWCHDSQNYTNMPLREATPEGTIDPPDADGGM